MALDLDLLPPGFRFHPTDVELILYYLKRKIMGKKLHYEAIAEVNIYKFSPWDLPDKSCLKSKDLEWFFFCPREKKYASGSRVKRATENGYWKPTGKDRSIKYNDQVVGTVKTLIFHLGHAPKGERTDWVLHEYTAAGMQDTYVLCKVFKKDGVGPKSGAQYGAPFNEADWGGDTILASDGPLPTMPTQTEVETPAIFSPPNQDGVIGDTWNKPLPCPDGRDTYDDLGDLDSWVPTDEDMRVLSWLLDDGCYLNNTSFQDNSTYIELDGLVPPVDCSSGVTNEDGVIGDIWNKPLACSEGRDDADSWVLTDEEMRDLFCLLDDGCYLQVGNQGSDASSGQPGYPRNNMERGRSADK